MTQSKLVLHTHTTLVAAIIEAAGTDVIVLSADLKKAVLLGPDDLPQLPDTSATHLNRFPLSTNDELPLAPSVPKPLEQMDIDDQSFQIKTVRTETAIGPLMVKTRPCTA